MVTDLHSREIMQVNAYIAELVGTEKMDLTGASITSLLSKASLIFMESYVYPSLLDMGIHSELQLTVMTQNEQRIPIVANIRFDGAQSLYWSIFSAVERDKLYQELIEARDQLEQQAIRLSELASIDPVTSFLNQRAAQTKIINVLAQTQRVPAPLTAIMFIVDQRLDVQQQLGQAVADGLLNNIAELLRPSFRAVDIVSRWNDSKFLIMCYDATVEDTQILCDKLQALAATVMVDGKKSSLSMGLISVSVTPRDPIQLLDTIISKADAALYISQASGGGQTVVFEH